MENMTAAALLTAYRAMHDPNRETDWNDFGGEIQAAWDDAVLEEMHKRGLLK